MQLEVIGVGGAGCRIADAIHAREPDEGGFVGTAYAFDTDSDAVTALSSIPVAHRHRYGQTVAGGLEGNLQQGFAVGEDHVDELSRQLDEGTPAVADAFLVCLGLGGATGGGTVPALVSNLKTLYDEPVYVLATLPAKRELEPGSNSQRDRERAGDPRANASEGATSGGDGEDARPMAEQNAVRTLERLEGIADAVVCFDNDEWLRGEEPLREARDRLNEELVARVSALFSAMGDERDGGAAETVVDANDLHRILGARTEIATIGYGRQQVDTGSDSLLGLGLFSSSDEVETTEAISAIETTINKALHGKLTLECERASASRALLLVGGPPAWLNRRAIADGRSVLESTTQSTEILSGDAPRPDSDQVFATVLLAGLDPAGRLETLREETRPLETDRYSTD
ncbi:tubulin/FtsZ family protein [Halopiger goleimassiliensis]|uniref:tubulin/FtsZ family protein n=1 Tax=Halopiger goleimassiliensis TaxID=1293048 RepID=UPI0006779B54|nr:tubulin/FtsZ family protein [Halopiger goleimassiliensis]